jgi:hypothetical protein
MKTILTFVGGGDRDAVILQTALAAHGCLRTGLPARHVPVLLAARYAHTEFARGRARNALENWGPMPKPSRRSPRARPRLRERRDRDVRTR